MTQRNFKVYWWDILQSCEAVRAFTRGRTFQEYLDDRAFRSSVEREMITIGEVLRSLREMDPSLLVPVPNAHQIIAFRHVLV